MSLPYRAIQWTERKFFYDLTLAVGIFIYLGVFVVVTLSQTGRQDWVEVFAAVTRAFGTLAVVLLHVVLAIGPLCRLQPRLLPLLANRRHLGVVTFLVALVHGVLATVLYHAGGEMNPLASILFGNGQVFSPNEFPFEVFGFLALLILAVLAASSHDFWIAYFTPAVWKRLHMAVYAAWLLVLLHLGFGVLQNVRNPVYPLLVFGASGLVLWLHLRAAAKEAAVDEGALERDAEGWIRVGEASAIPEDRAVVVSAGSERIAVFRHWQGISAISNVCAHQGGPLGEGKVAAGCIRCPWHGALYFPETGTSPPPFEKAIPTFPLKVQDGVVWVLPVANPLGTRTEPLLGRAKPVRGARLSASSGVVSAVVPLEGAPDKEGS